MFTRLRASLRALLAPAPCASCAQLRTALARADAVADYWRAREERTADRLLELKGVAPTAAVPTPPVMDAARSMFAALGVHEIDSRRSSSQPGQVEMTLGADA